MSFSSFPSLQMLTGFSSHICASTPKGTPYMCPNFLAEVISLLYVLFEVLVPQESGVANLQSWYASHVHTSGTPITNYPRLRQVSCIDHLFLFVKNSISQSWDQLGIPSLILSEYITFLLTEVVLIGFIKLWWKRNWIKRLYFSIREDIISE